MTSRSNSKFKIQNSKLLWLLLPILALLIVACQDVTPRPTLEAPVELITPSVPPTQAASRTPRPIQTATRQPSPTITESPFPTLDPLRPTTTLINAPPPDTVEPDLLTQVALAQTATLAPNMSIIGYSVEERPIIARQFGDGPQIILLVGAIHGGFEANTGALLNEVADHFEDEPQEVAPGIALVVVAVANPDGLVRGREEAARFNANGVDLNRNWGCHWSEQGVWRDRIVDAGPEPFSEPESAALADYVLLHAPVSVLFYHSAANGVFAGACDGDHGSQVLGHVYGDAANYRSDSRFSAYQVTGDASNWVDGLGIPSITVELQSWTDPEFDRNYAGIMAVQCEIARATTDRATQEWVIDQCDE